MSVMFLVNREDELIDSLRPQTNNASPVATQANLPDENLQTIGEPKLQHLPNPSVGGVNASRERNGFSNGFKSLWTRTQRFSGAVAKPPAIVNSVQGTVGTNDRAGKLYAGVMDQSTTYNAAQSFGSAYVGAMPTPGKKS